VSLGANIDAIGPVCRGEFCWECLTGWRRVTEQGNRGHDRACQMWRDEGPEALIDFFPHNPRPAQPPIPRRAGENTQSGRRQRQRLSRSIDLSGGTTEARPRGSSEEQDRANQTTPRPIAFQISNTAVGDRIRAFLRIPRTPR
jgi:hypothetical protein